VPVAADGSWSARLWASVDGGRKVAYQPQLAYYNSASKTSLVNNFPVISVPATGPVNFADLLTLPVDTVTDATVLAAVAAYAASMATSVNTVNSTVATIAAFRDALGDNFTTLDANLASVAASTTAAATSSTNAAASATAAAASSTSATASKTNAAASATAAAASATDAAYQASLADAASTDAATTVTTVTAARNATQTYDNEAKAARDAAQSYAASAASAVVYQDLSAVANSNATTVVAAIVYDTSLDSDGGAWRKRAWGSWYYETLNTTTRGATREFPAVVKLEATTSAVTLYDATDPALPMWRVHTLTGLTVASIAARDGHIVVGTTSGVVTINFPADRLRVAPNYTASTSPALVSNSVTSVAIATLPTSPVDPATGLPVPTIAVGTAAGVSVILDKATVVNSAATGVVYNVSVDGSWMIYQQASVGQHCTTYLPSLGAAFVPTAYTTATVPAIPQPVASTSKLAGRTTGGGGGLTRLSENPSSPTTGMAAYMTSTYLTGWLVGAIKGCWLASVSATSLVASGELVTNGTFATDVSGWTATGTPGTQDTTFAWGSSGAMSVSRGTGSTTGYPGQIVPVVAGSTYRLSVSLSGAGAVLRADGYTMGGSSYGTLTFSAPAITFKASSSSLYLGAWGNASVTITVDNVSCQLVDADRSANNNGLLVNGTVTRTPVATGAALMGYSGFSATNYLQQLYNPALDFGTGDFCVMGWGNFGAYAGALAHRTSTYNVNDVASGFALYSPGNSVVARVGTKSIVVQAATDTVWHHYAMVRAAGVLYAYLDGVLVGSVACTDAVSDSAATLFIGSYLYNSALVGFGASAALVRIGATAPTAAQLTKLYRDESPLFQPGAQGALLQNSVTALASDPVTGLTYVGQGSLGSAVFKGLVRVGTDATPVTTAISAVNGMVVSQ
jgi:hypothetical protein